MAPKKFVILFVFACMFIWRNISLGEVPLESLIPKKDLPEGWFLKERPRSYTKKTLFEHINGQAELFFKYGYQQSVFAIYQNKKITNSQIELDIYDMGKVLQAFGIFSRFRSEDRPGGFGLDSYLDNHYSFFYKGKYFVMLYATEPNLSTLKDLAMRVSQRILENSPLSKEIDYFPKDKFKPGSIQYFSEGLLGYKFLGKGFQGTYMDEDKEFRLFIAIFGNSQEAIKALEIYKSDLSKKGKIRSEISTLLGFKGLRGEDPYQGQVIVVQKGFYLLGAVGFEKEVNGERRLAEFIKNVK